MEDLPILACDEREFPVVGLKGEGYFDDVFLWCTILLLN